MNKNDINFRLENKSDHRQVEELVRDSFWNVYRPGCSEHYVLHKLRDDPAFVKELDFVMEKDGRITGQNIFVKTVIKADDGRDIPVLTMGPICIANDLKRKGYVLRAISTFTARADLIIQANSGYATTTCPRTRINRFSCVRNCKTDTLTVSREYTSRRRATMPKTGTWRSSIRAFLTKKS